MDALHTYRVCTWLHLCTFFILPYLRFPYEMVHPNKKIYKTYAINITHLQKTRVLSLSFLAQLCCEKKNCVHGLLTWRDTLMEELFAASPNLFRLQCFREHVWLEKKRKEQRKKNPYKKILQRHTCLHIWYINRYTYARI